MYYPSEIVRNQWTIQAYQEMLPDRRAIGCWDTKAWTRFIGCSKIVFGLVSILLSFTTIHSYLDVKDEHNQRPQLSYHQTVIHNGVNIITHVGSIILAIILLYGATIEDERSLAAWLIYNAISTGMEVSTCISEYMEGRYDPSFAWTLLQITILLSINGFFMWIVSVYRMEIKEHRLMRRPTIMPHPPHPPFFYSGYPGHNYYYYN